MCSGLTLPTVLSLLSDVDAKELDTLNPLHYSPVDVDGGMLSPLSPVVHDQLLGLTDVEREVVVMAPHCQVSSHRHRGSGLPSSCQ